MTAWNASAADIQDEETLAQAAGVTPPDRFFLRFCYRRAGGDWSTPLYVRAKHEDGRPASGHAATEKREKAGFPSLEAAQLRHLGFLTAVMERGVNRHAVQVELIDDARWALLEEWSRAAGR